MRAKWISPAARRLAPALALLLPWCGCEMLRLPDSWRVTDRRTLAEETRAQVLKPVPKPRDAFEVEILFAECPVGDPLLGPELWNDLAHPGETSPATRKVLEKNGFRIGTCGSAAPRALQELLARSLRDVLAVQSGDGEFATATTLVSRRLAIQSGGDTEIVTAPTYPTCTISTSVGDDSRRRSYQLARCVFRVSAERVQDGWVRLEFQPEVHHGEMKNRHIARNGGFALAAMQQVDPLAAGRFSVTLNLGEMIVVSAAPAAPPDSLGRHFFVGADEGAAMQRLVVVRLADMKRTDPVFSK